MYYTFDFSTCITAPKDRFYADFSLDEKKINDTIEKKMRELGKTKETSRNITTSMCYDNYLGRYLVVILITCCFTD